MERREQPALINKMMGPPIFLIGGLAATGWFFYRAGVLFHSLSSQVVVFDKGSYYMLGVGMGLLVLGFVLVQEFWTGKELTKKQSAALTKVALLSLVLLFVVPHIADVVVGAHLTDAGYSVCDESSSHWLHVRTIVYVKEIACREGLAN